MTTMQQLNSKNALNEELKQVKRTSDSKLKASRKSNTDIVNSSLLKEAHRDKDNAMDPYSKTTSKSKVSTSKSMSLSNSVHQTSLLEKILQSQSNPEKLESEIKFREKTVSLLTEVRDILDNKFGKKALEAEAKEEEAVKTREASSLAKNIASMNTKGIMKDLVNASKSNADKYGALSLMTTMSEVIKETVASGGLADLIKGQIEESLLGTLGNKNKTLIKDFKNDPVRAIQDMLNVGSLSGNKGLSTLLKSFYKGDALKPTIVTKSRDMTKAMEFDLRSHTTLNTVIPDLLSKLVSIGEGGEQRKYNYSQGKWESVGQIMARNNSGDSVSKYIKDVSDVIKSAMAETVSISPNSSVAKNVIKGKKTASGGNVYMSNTAINAVIANISKSSLSLRDVVNVGNLADAVSRFGLAKGTTKDEAIMALNLIRTSLRTGVPFSDLSSESMSFEERKYELGNIKENKKLADLTSEESSLYSRLGSGEIDKSEFKALMRQLRGSGSGGGHGGRSKTIIISDKTPEQMSIAKDKASKSILNASGHNYGTVNDRVNSANQSTRGYAMGGAEDKREHYVMLNNVGLLSDKDLETLTGGSKKGRSTALTNAEKGSSKLLGANALFSKFLQVGATADRMAQITGESVTSMKRRGYFTSPAELLQFVNNDGSINQNKLEKHNAMYSARYLKEVDGQIRSNRDGIDFDITDPGKSVGKVMDELFSDPALAKKLGMGAGGATGYALGKLINNKTFIKSPKLGYMLGAVGAGIMSMERTQSFMNQTFGPDSGDKSGYSNREILTAKLMQSWLPGAGVGIKSAQLTAKALGSLGPAGKLLSLPASLVVGGVMGAVTPSILEGGRKLLFENDNKDSMFSKIGTEVSKIPMFKNLISPSDNRSDLDVFASSLKLETEVTNKRITELEAKKSKTPADIEELATMKAQQKKLKKISTTLGQVSGIKDTDKRNKEFNILLEDNADVTGYDELKRKYKAELDKRERTQELGPAHKAKFNFKSKEDRTASYVKSELDHPDFKKPDMSQASRRRYNLLSAIEDDGVNSLMNDSVASYLENNGDLLSAIADSVIEDDTLVESIGPSFLNTRTDAQGNIIKGLNDIETKAEFEQWKKTLPPEARTYVDDYMSKKGKVLGIRDGLREMARIKVEANYPGIPRQSPKMEKAIEYEISNAIMNNKNIGAHIKSKTGNKVKFYQNKIMGWLGEGGTDSDTITENKHLMEKLEGFMGGGKGVNELTKMKDLKGFKFKNGAKLTVAGCSVVSANNALNYLGIGGISIDYLITKANSYLTDDGGVTSDFFKDVCSGLGLEFKTFNSIDNNFTNDMLLQFKPSRSTGVIYLIRNSSGIGSHYVNINAINSNKAFVNDPEETGITEMSTSTLCSALVEVITISKTGASKKATQSSSNDSDNRSVAKRIAKKVGAGLQIAGGESSAMASVGGAISKLAGASGSANGGGIVDVRIVDDMTLALKTTDRNVAMKILKSQSQSGGSSVAKGALQSVKRLFGDKVVADEFSETQRVQDDASRTAEAVESMASAGFGGAGGGAVSTTNDVKGGGMLGAIATLLGLGGFQGLSLMKDGWENLLQGNMTAGKTLVAGGASGMFKLGKAVTKVGGGIAKSVIKKVPFGNKLLDMGGKLSAKVAGRMGVVKKLYADFAPDVLLGKLSKKVIGYFADGDVVSKIVDKIPVPGFIKTAIIGRLTKKGGIAKKTVKFITNLMGKFTAKFAKLAGKGASKTIPGIGLALALAEAGYSFIVGFKDGEELMSRELSMGERVLVGIAKMLWDGLPNIVGGLLAMLPVPGVGSMVSLIASIFLVFLQEEYGGFVKFAETIGLKDEDDNPENMGEKRDGFFASAFNKVKDGVSAVGSKIKSNHEKATTLINSDATTLSTMAPGAQNNMMNTNGASIPVAPGASSTGSQSQIMLSGGYKDVIPGMRNVVVTSAFGPRNGRMHRGIDFRGKTGTPVYASSDGIVTFAGDSGNGGGLVVKVKHADGTESEYMHLDKIRTEVGAVVKGGVTRLGDLGATGGNYLPHLHYGMRDASGAHIDPFLRLGLNPGKLKKATSPENDAWKIKNSNYVETYSDEISDMARAKADEKGGPTVPLSPASKQDIRNPKIRTKAQEKGGMGGGSNMQLALSTMMDRMEQMEGTNLALMNKLLQATNQVTMLLTQIASNTNESSNNNMKEAMNLSM